LEDKTTFEEALERLEHIVERLEGGQLPLDEAVQAFEEGISLVKLCGRRLQQAEKKIHRLSQQTLEMFASTGDGQDDTTGVDEDEGEGE
jgi:exodeoxyribonuclease VII small subunit